MSDALSRSLTTDIGRYEKQRTLIPGVYVGFDPAELQDRSALVVLGKDVPTIEIPEPKLKCRLMRDLSISGEGLKNVTYLEQARMLIKMDKKMYITKLMVDVTSHRAVFEFLQEYFGSRAEGITFTKPLKLEMINATRVAFQERMIEFDKSHLYYDVLRRELYELHPEKLKHNDKGSDDFVWSLSMAIRATSVLQYKSGVDSGESDEELIF